MCERRFGSSASFGSLGTKVSFNSAGAGWSLTTNGIFLVSSMYKALIIPIQSVVNNKSIWKMKISLKAKVFA
jgi:hypothetical protein